MTVWHVNATPVTGDAKSKPMQEVFATFETTRAAQEYTLSMIQKGFEVTATTDYEHRPRMKVPKHQSRTSAQGKMKSADLLVPEETRS